MKKLFSILPKKAWFALVTLAAIAGIGIGVQAGFGPDRPTYTMAHPADHITFNSITDNPLVGDERAFVRGALPGASGYSDPVTGAKDGEEVTIEVFVHNDAASNLNLVAKNTKVRIALPSGSNRTQTVTGYVSADNAQPVTIHDTLDITGANNGTFELQYIAGSARLKTNKLDSVKLSDNIVTSGATIGYDALDGNVPGCSEFAGWVTLKVKVNMPNYAVQKSVRLAGEDSTKWRERANVKIGDKVQWLIRVTNIGSTNLSNIVVLDELPPYMTAEKGSVKLIDDVHPASNPYVYDDSAIQQKDGKVYVNVDSGTYAPNSGAYVMFDSVVTNNKAISCGNQLLTNLAYATPKSYGSVSDIAQVIVVNDTPCENQTPIYSCDALDVKTIGGREIEATVAYTAKSGATFSDVSYTFGDSNSLVTDKTTVKHTYATDGVYTIKAVPSFMVDGKKVTAESQNCVKVVKFESGNPVPPETPSVLPNTGAGSLIGLFAGSSLVGTLGYRFWASKRRQ